MKMKLIQPLHWHNLTSLFLTSRTLWQMSSSCMFSHCRRIVSVSDRGFIDVHFGSDFDFGFSISHKPKAIAAVITTTAIPIITIFILFIKT